MQGKRKPEPKAMSQSMSASTSVKRGSTFISIRRSAKRSASPMLAAAAGV